MHSSSLHGPPLRSDLANHGQLDSQGGRTIPGCLHCCQQSSLFELNRKENILDNILFYGLFQNEDQLKDGLEDLEKETEKIKALKAQLNFRKHILDQKAEKKLYLFSTKGKNLTSEELKANTLVLINQACQIPNKDSEHYDTAVKNAMAHVGKKIIHTLVLNGQRKNYLARIISIVPGYPSWFNIKYERIDDSCIYVLNLLKTMKELDAKFVLPGMDVEAELNSSG